MPHRVVNFELEMAAVFAASCFAAGVLVAANRRFGAFRSARDDSAAVQASHVFPAPRIGSFAFLLALMWSLLFMEREIGARVASILLCAAPLAAVGVREDLRGGVSPLSRLAAAAVSAALVIVFVGRWITRFDVPFLDAALGVLPFAWLATVLAVSGLAHAFNLVDGLNGLCLSVGVAAAGAMALIGFAADDPHLAEVIALALCAMAGVLVWNYPSGRIFLGDAGAYALGFLLAWLAIGLVSRNPQVSAWAVLLTCFWPVAETTLSILRRLRAGRTVSAPDRQHTHQLVLALLERRWPNRRGLTNPLATALLIPFIVAPPAVGVVLWGDPQASFLAAALFWVAFVTAYLVLLAAAREAPAQHASAQHAHGEDARAKDGFGKPVSVRDEPRATALERLT